MSLKRPGFKPSLKANLESTKLDKLFVDIPKESSMLFRFYNPSIEDPANPGKGTIWFRVAQHFRLKTEEGRGMAVADLSVHGTEETGKVDYISKLVNVLLKHGDKAEQAIAKGLSTSFRWNAQVAIAEKQEDGTLTFKGPKILGLPRTGAQAVNEVEKAADMAGEVGGPFDIDKGFNIMITRHPGQPWYTAQRAGSPVSLDEIIPGWEGSYISDLKDKVGLKVLTYDEQREAVMRTYAAELDWDLLQSEFDL